MSRDCQKKRNPHPTAALIFLLLQHQLQHLKTTGELLFSGDCHSPPWCKPSYCHNPPRCNHLREAPLKLASPLFGHCPNSDYTPPPALKRALWGTFFPGRFEQICQFTVLTVQTPPKSRKCPFELGKFFSKKVPQTIRARV